MDWGHATLEWAGNKWGSGVNNCKKDDDDNNYNSKNNDINDCNNNATKNV